MAIRLLRISALAALLCAPACTSASGFIYTDVVEPYCENMDNTPAGTLSGKSATLQFRVPYVAPGLTAVFNSNAIADAAAGSGITELHYCDLKTLSILGGIYKRQNIIIYGN